MKRLELLLIIVLFFFSLSCKKESPQKGIDIRYTITDDVTPVKVLFSVDGDFTRSEWVVNDSFILDSQKKNKSEYIFFKERIGKVKVNAYSEDGTKYSGEKIFEIPSRIATKLEITGVFFKYVEGNYLPLEDKEYKIIFEFNNGIDYFGRPENNYITRVFNPTGLKMNDTIFFKEPVEFDISGFEKSNSNYSIGITLSTLDNRELRNQYLSNFGIKSIYYIERNLLIGRIQLFYTNDKGQTGTYFLVSDWKP